MAGSASSPCSWAQASSNALAIISVWSVLKLVCESRDRIGMALLPRSVTRSLVPFRSQNKASREPCGPGSITQCVLLREYPPWPPRTWEAPGSRQAGFSAYLPRERSALLRHGPAFFTTRFTSAFDLPVIEGGRRGLGKMREPRLESAGSILPQPSRYVIQCLGSLQYRLGQEHPQV